MSKKVYDTIIVGGGLAGLAGLAAARELGWQGYSVLLLEARERWGGRAWSDERLGQKVEMGGTWFHWMQPHIWTEVMRYQLAVTHTPAPETAYWIAGNQRTKGASSSLMAMLDQGMAALEQEAEDVFPHPFQPLTGEKLPMIDHLSIDDRLQQLPVTRDVYALMHSLWALAFHGSPEQGGLAQALRWLALSQWDWKTMLELFAAYQLKEGTETLVNHMAEDIRGDTRRGVQVTSVEDHAHAYRVKTHNGDTYEGTSVMITLPLQLLSSMSISPPWSRTKELAIKEGQTSEGIKIWARVRGWEERAIALAPAHYPLNYVQYEGKVGEDQLLVGFGPDAGRLDGEDDREVERALRYWEPGVQVVESTAHNWVQDPWSKQTWTMYQKHQLTRFHRALQEPERGLFLAGSGYADGWAGFMDGAIESGITRARQVTEYLQNQRK